MAAACGAVTARSGRKSGHSGAGMRVIWAVSPRCGRFDGCEWGVTVNKLLLSVVELGGYPNFAPLYTSCGYEVAMVNSMRKAIGFLKKRQPAVIVAEFNFQSDFRDRTSSLETLLSSTQGVTDASVIVFYDREYRPQFEKLSARLPVDAALAFPIEESALRASLEALGGDQKVDA